MNLNVFENLVNLPMHIFELQKSITTNQCIIFKLKFYKCVQIQVAGLEPIFD
jgi:hypothetical protein